MNNKKYFLKEIVQTPVPGPDGKPVAWERLGQSYGVIETDAESETAKWLSECARKGIYGVSEVTQQEYEDYKKKYPYSPSESSQQQIQIRVVEAPQAITPKLYTAEEVPAGRDPFKDHVASAMAKASARLAAASENATSAVATDSFGNDQQQARPETIQRIKKSVGRPRKAQPPKGQ